MARKPNPEPRARIAAEVPLPLRQAVYHLAQAEDTSMAALMEEAFRKLLIDREVEWR